jgi:hypothetical protein
MFLQRSEVEKSFHLVRESMGQNASDVFWGTGTLEGRAQTIQIPVDSFTKRITFTFSVDTQGAQLRLLAPSGRTIVQAADVDDTELVCGRVVTVNSPEPGVWRAEMTGSGRFWLEAQAHSDIYFINVEFVKLGGRPAHEGYFRINGQPVAGSPATLQASLSAASTETTDIQLVSERGDVIGKLPMQVVDPDRDFMELLGTLELPQTPFRVAVTGRDKRGRQYQRFFSGLFHAETVEVTPIKDFDELAPGTTRQATFTIRNTGAARRFKLTVTDAHRLVTKVEPAEMELASGASTTVRVDLTAPVGIAPGSGDDIIVVAASTTGASTSNSGILNISIARK